MKTVLVTGIAGFIGAWTAKALQERGVKVIGLDNFSDYYDVTLKRNRVKHLASHCKIYEADCTDVQAIERLFSEEKIDQICHLAAQAGVRYSLENPIAYEKNNILGTLNLLEQARKNKILSFIYASSSSVYGGNTKIPFAESDPVHKPISLYAATKLADELMAYTYHHLYKMHCTGLRFFTAYGPWGRPDMALFKFTKALLQGDPIDVYNFGKMKRDFTYISDLLQGIVSALEKNHAYEIFNLGNSKTVELQYFIECIEKELGVKAQKNLLPLQPGDVVETFADSEKSKRLLGYNPQVSIEKGIKEFVGWFKGYYK